MKKTISKLKWLPIFALILGVIAVSCKDDEEIPDPVYVISTNVASITLDMNEGDVVTETITASTTEDGAAFTESYTFTSADPLVATVNSSTGVVTAVAGGTTTITVEGQVSGQSKTVAVTVVAAEPAPTFTKEALLDGSVKYTWDPAKMTITDVVVYDETGETELIKGGPDDDKNAIDYIFESDYAQGMFVLTPTGRSDNFKADLTVLVKITVDGADDPVWKNPTLHNKLAYTATLSTVTFEWDTASVNSGVVPAGINVFLRNDPVADGEPYTKGDAVSYATVGDIDGDTLVAVTGLISNESYWFDVVDADDNILWDTQLTMPSPITQVKAGNTESVWYGDASSAENKYAEVRRIADRISIGQGLTVDDIASVKIKDAAGNVIAELGAWSQDIAVYEYSYINTNAPNVIATFDAAVALEGAYIHEKIDPDDGKNGEFKHISFFDIPYSEEKYTVELTDNDGMVYTKEYETKKKASTLNRSEVRANDHVYADMADINAKDLVFMANSNIPNDTWTFEVSDPAVATIDASGLIKFVANGISTITASAEAGTLEYQVAAAPIYCKNYYVFNNGIEVGASKDMEFGDYLFASATSSDEAIATVDGKSITGVAEGSAVITITDDQGNEAIMTVTVVAAAGE
ncbi:Ig-like domain-containing protein [Sunxiuqinia indica]|uniref:Ig-like domain-containing protein n=1 Tax=Sunxiuqinia indica TaxID=2692584 RepID=UPI00135BDBBE|nr:hypothetical protein [Sunxiuqinia indica]